MPWTRRQVKYMLSNGSPLSGQQKTKMTGELHANPSMGHMKKGFKRITPTQASKIRKQASL